MSTEADFVDRWYALYTAIRCLRADPYLDWNVKVAAIRLIAYRAEEPLKWCKEASDERRAWREAMALAIKDLREAVAKGVYRDGA